MPVLEIRNLSKKFGGLEAVKNVSMNIELGKVTGVIGPNGAGKTTLFNLVTGFLRPDSGYVILDGRNITGIMPHEVVLYGMTRTFQLVRVFPRMTVLENIMLGFNDLPGDSLFSAIFSTKKMKQEYKNRKEQTREILKYIGLIEYENNIANDLSYGQQKLVEIGRALAADPKVLLLDEPMAGLNVVMIEKMLALIEDIKNRNKAVVLIEHNMDVINSISDVVFVLNFGQLIASGSPVEVMKCPEVVESYLGIDNTKR